MKRGVIALLVMLSACSQSEGIAPGRDIAAVLITTSSATLRPGEMSQLTALAVDSHGTEIAFTGTVTWASSAPSVASVSSSGQVTAATAGTTSISATVQSITGTRLVTVLPPGAGAVVTMPGFSFVPFQVTVHRGEDVYFEFPREPHNVIFARVVGAPADIQETRNVTIPRRFDTAGQFAYDCTLHPGMSGVVIVNP